MPLTEKIAHFQYEEALAELGIRSRTHLLSQLQAAARQQSDLVEAQMVHDLNWMLTQLPTEQQHYLQQICRAIEDSLAGTYGPHGIACFGQFGLTIESFLIPLAKTLDGDSGNPATQLLKIIGREPPRLPPHFAGLFARWWTWKQLASAMHSATVRTVQRGRRARLGWITGHCNHCNDKRFLDDRVQAGLEQIREGASQRVEGAGLLAPDRGLLEGAQQKLRGFMGRILVCAHCDGTSISQTLVQAALAGMRPLINPQARILLNMITNHQPVTVDDVRAALGDAVSCHHCNGSGLDAAKCQAAAGTPLPACPQKTLLDFLTAAQPDGSMSLENLIEGLGEGILCPECTRWVDIPAGARTDWICPVVDARQQQRDWVRVVIEG